MHCEWRSTSNKEFGEVGTWCRLGKVKFRGSHSGIVGAFVGIMGIILRMIYTFVAQRVFRRINMGRGRNV